MDTPRRKEALRRPAISFSLLGLLLGSCLTLAACGEMPAARTNCWTGASAGVAEVSQAAIRPGMLVAPAPADPSSCD